MNKTVTIVNAHWSNRGDEAALRPIIDVLLSRGAQLTVIFKDKQDVQDFPYENVNYFSAQFLPNNIDEIFQYIRDEKRGEIDTNLEKTIATIRLSDMIIYSPGGAVISSNFWWVKQLEYLTPFICAKEFKIPIVVAAPSMGPFNQEDSLNEVICEYISYAENIILREPISREYLEKIGVRKAVSSIDTAFYSHINVDECNQFLCRDRELCSFLDSYERIVAVTLSDFAWSVPLKNDTDRLRENEVVMQDFINKLTHEKYGILFIPQLFGNQNDSTYLEKFSTSGTLILSNKYDTYFQQFIIGKCYALVGMRYHSNIFAAKVGTPFIALGYEEKMYGFMEEWGLTEYLLRIKTLSLNELLYKWDMLCINHDQIQKQLKSFRNEWQERSHITMNAIMSVLEELK